MIEFPIGRPLIADYLPHKDPLLLLDRLCGRGGGGEVWLEAQVDVTAESLFYDPAWPGVPAWVAFEYMAQAIAALSGVAGREADGGQPKIGFILGIRDFSCAVDAFRAGQTLDVRVAQIFRDGAVVSFQCQVRRAGEELAAAVVNAIEVDEQSLKNFGADNA